MFGNPQKVLATERLLQNLAQCGAGDQATPEIPGNFRAQQRRKMHDDSRLVFPEHKYKAIGSKGIPHSKRQVGEKHQTHYTLNFKPTKQICRPSERPCSPTRRNNPHPSKVTKLLISC